MKNSLKYILAILFIGSAGLSFTSCINDLDTIPLDPDELVSEKVFGKDLPPYTEALAKIYAGMAMSGNESGDGDADVAGVDGGSQASYLRGLWNLQELPTDEVHCCWNDAGIPDLNHISWSPSNPFIKGLYYRLAYQVMIANAYLRETTGDKLGSRGVNDADKATIKSYRADARFLRALSYYHLLDLFRNPPFVTEEDPIGSKAPRQTTAKELFAYIETELKECEADMLDLTAGYDSKNYGRAGKTANWALLSRLYLNAEVYINENKYTDAVTYSKKVIEKGYRLEPVYLNLFKADNHKSEEIIFPIRYEGDATMTWGGMTFLLCSGEPSALQGAVNAVGAWQGNRARSSVIRTFEAEANHANDSRFSMVRLDYTSNPEIIDESKYINNGTPVVKYYNVYSDGALPPTNTAYVDFPMFRLAEIYLNYAEAVLRGGSGGTKSEALNYVNQIRTRAYGNTSGNIAESELTLDFILHERGREFLYEAQRRTDLVRFDKFTGASYYWPWKGGIANGQSIAAYLAVYPIPSDDINANKNLTQNQGYK
jgi:hypothetical protein